MALSLGQAAVAVGMSKPTIQRAIKNGKLSASHNEDGSYSINESELARVYPDQWRNRHVTGTLKQDETPSIPEVLRTEIEGLRQQIAMLRDERDDLRRRLDAEAEERRRLTRLLTDQRAAVSVPIEKPGGWRTGGDGCGLDRAASAGGLTASATSRNYRADCRGDCQAEATEGKHVNVYGPGWHSSSGFKSCSKRSKACHAILFNRNP